MEVGLRGEVHLTPGDVVQASTQAHQEEPANQEDRKEADSGGHRELIACRSPGSGSHSDRDWRSRLGRWSGSDWWSGSTGGRPEARTLVVGLDW